MTISLQSRARGAIWGTCVGDALGGPVQFKQRGTFQAVEGLQPITSFRKPSGSYSDDGATTLALAQSFIEAQGAYDHLLSIRLLLDWISSGRFSTSPAAWDVGVTTRQSLSIWKKEGFGRYAQWRGDAALRVPATQRKVDAVLAADSRSGNGSLMRMSPLGVIMFRDREAARRAARQQSSITHPAPACAEACAMYADLICRVMDGETKEALALVVASTKIQHLLLSERISQYRDLLSWKKQASEQLVSSGWVIDTLEVALWAFFKFDSWREGALAVVNLGGDADTAGAIYGGLAGAFYGMEAIPVEWVEGMQKPELIAEVSNGVAELVQPA